jgi:hypothetical protein
VHIDFAGPFLGKMFLISVDAHSKWIDVGIMNNITAETTINELRKLFAIHGLPDMIVSDNGPTFVSEKFREFVQMNGIIHSKSSIYHPATNGLAERAVQTFKNALLKMSNGTIEQKVARFLISYRSTPNSVTGLSPAELLLGRKIKTRIDLVHNDVVSNVNKARNSQKLAHDVNSKFREFFVNDKVFVKNFNAKYPRYVPGVIVNKIEPYSYNVLSNSIVKRVHVDHIIGCENNDDIYNNVIEHNNSENAVEDQTPIVSGEVNVRSQEIQNQIDDKHNDIFPKQENVNTKKK